MQITTPWWKRAFGPIALFCLLQSLLIVASYQERRGSLSVRNLAAGIGIAAVTAVAFVLGAIGAFWIVGAPIIT